ncbi:MAG: hypothetical protein ACP5I4_16860 [Oceanipulchritudo sp.]
MKKLLLISFIGFIFAASGAYAHCGACGAGDADHEQAAKSECTAEKKAECAKEMKCCSEGKSCCSGEKKSCPAGGDKEKAEDAVAKPAKSLCCPAMSGKPA